MTEILYSLGFRLASDPAFFAPYLFLVGSIAIALLRRLHFVTGRRSNRYLWVLYPLLAVAIAGLFLALGSPVAWSTRRCGVEHPLQAEFGEQVELLGYTLSKPVVQPGNTVHLTLCWRAKAPVEDDYSLFVHVLHQDWIRITQSDHFVGRDYLSGQWLQDELVVETTDLQIPLAVDPGDYPIAIGLYQWQTGERLPAFVGGQRLEADTLFLPQFITVVD